MMTALAHLCVMIVRSRQLEASRRRQTKRLRPGVTGSGSPSDRLKHDVETHAAHAISLYDKTLDERQHTDRAKRKGGSTQTAPNAKHTLESAVEAGQPNLQQRNAAFRQPDAVCYKIPCMLIRVLKQRMMYRSG